MDKVTLAAAFARIERPWTPHLAAALNGQHVRLAVLEGPFVWHRHADEDELFLVVDGRLRIERRDGDVVLEPGELLVVPRGTEHRPDALPRAEVLLFEPASTLNTGNVRDARTLDVLPRL